LFAQLNWRLTDTFSLIGGARSDEHSIYAQQTTFRLGAVSSYTKDTTIKILTGSSFKAPPVLLMFGGQHPRFLGPLPNSSLIPQEAKTTEFNIGTKLSKNIRLGFTAYDSKVENFAEYDTLAANPQAKNRGQIDVQGIELELNYQFSEPRIDGFVSLSNVNSSVSTDSAVDIGVSEQTRLYPKFSFSAGVNYQFENNDLRAFGLFYYLDERAADKSNLPFLPVGQQQEYFLPSYQLWELGIEKNNLNWFGANSGSLQLVLKNAFEERYQEPGFSGIDVPGLERQIHLSYQQRF